MFDPRFAGLPGRPDAAAPRVRTASPCGVLADVQEMFQHGRLWRLAHAVRNHTSAADSIGVNAVRDLLFETAVFLDSRYC